MHAAFADWYRSISVEPVLGQLQLRWRGLEALVEESVADDLLNLSRAFFGFPLSPEFAGRFRGFFKAVDEAFPQARNDAEIRTLAGAALVAHFEKEEWGDAAALALVVGAAAGQRKPSVPDILDLAREHVSERAAAIRARERLESTPPDTDAHLKALVAAANSNATTNLVEPLKAWMEALGQYFSETTYRENVLREESEILWWLFGGRSHDLACALTEIKEPAASLIIGKELGALIRIVPGPVGADAFLTAALKASGQTSSKEISLASSISACPKAWRVDLAKEDFMLGDLAPVTYAIRQSVEHSGKTLKTIVDKACGTKLDQPVSPLTIARQLYLETVLSTAMRGL